MDKKQLVILIIAGVVLFLLGGVLGVISTQKNPAQMKVEAVNSLSSKVVSSIIAYGQVTNIEGRNITLSNLGQSLTISIADNAKFYSFATSTTSKNGTVATVQKTVALGDIKIGDSVNITIKLLPTGQIQGTSVIVLPNILK